MLAHVTPSALAFANGNIVVYRVGTGVGTLIANAAAAFLDEYTPGGTLYHRAPTSDRGNQMLTASGSSTTKACSP